LLASATDSLTRRDLVAYLRGLLAQTAELDDRSLIVRRLVAGGLKVKARFTDEGLAAHYCRRLGGRLLPDQAETDIRIDVIETSRLGWPAPAAWSDTTYDEDYFDLRLEEAGLRGVYPYQPRLWQMFDRAGRRGLQFAGSPDDLPVWDPGAPLRLPLHWGALELGRRRLVHAAVVGEGEDGVLLAGPGGAGKSGTTLAAIAHGLDTVGDDYVMIELGAESTAWSVYRLLKQDLRGIERIPGLRDRLGPLRLNWQSKAELDPEEVFPGSFLERMRLRAIVVPRIGGGSVSRLEPIRRGEAIEVVTRSTISQLPGEKRAAVALFTGLAARMPAYRLHLSSDGAEIAETLRGLVRGLR
jgi:hypothetical protein